MVANTWSAQIDERWQHFKTCTCGGTLKWKYRKVDNHKIELHVLPNKGVFRILEGKKQVKHGNIGELKTALETI